MTQRIVDWLSRYMPGLLCLVVLAVLFVWYVLYIAAMWCILPPDAFVEWRDRLNISPED